MIGGDICVEIGDGNAAYSFANFSDDDGCIGNIVQSAVERMDVIVHDHEMIRHLVGVNDKTLVLFDIDKTLIYSPFYAANDDCFGHIMDHHMQFHEKADARGKTLQIHNLMSNYSDFVLVASEVKDIFAYLRAQNVDFMGLTARDAPMAATTLKQLEQVGLSFSEIHNENFDLQCRPKGRFEEQIIFADAGHKGQCLLEFLQKSEYGVPEKIIFIDDKEKNLHQVRETCAELGIDFYGLRYSVLDAWTSQIDARVCHEQTNSFLTPLMDYIKMDHHKCKELHRHFNGKGHSQHSHGSYLLDHDICYEQMSTVLSSFVIA